LDGGVSADEVGELLVLLALVWLGVGLLVIVIEVVGFAHSIYYLIGMIGYIRKESYNCSEQSTIYKLGASKLVSFF
jgi:hypothetical protein